MPEIEVEKGTKVFETIMTENFIKLMFYTKPRIQESQRTSNRTNVKTTSRHILLDYIKIKNKILKKDGTSTLWRVKDKKYA